MVTLAEIIRAPKSDIVIGSWKTGKVPASAFPIGKQKRLPQAEAWQWRVVEFKVPKYECRVLIRLNSEIQYFSSILSIDNGELIQIICHHEIHLSHKNWHCHFVPGDVSRTYPGVLRDRDLMRSFEAEPSKAPQVSFEVDEFSALAYASQRYRFDAPDETPAQPRLL